MYYKLLPQRQQRCFLILCNARIKLEIEKYSFTKLLKPFYTACWPSCKQVFYSTEYEYVSHCKDSVLRIL